jgi:hypothetical protein
MNQQEDVEAITIMHLNKSDLVQLYPELALTPVTIIEYTCPDKLYWVDLTLVSRGKG